MRSILHFCAVLLLLTPTLAFGQYYDDGLKILNPDAPFYKAPASFDSVYMMVTPHGTYANVDITMELSAKRSGMQHQDSSEIEYKFSLPAGSHIHAAWLWMGHIQVPAELYEKNRANMIYEGLVSRKIDPLIIYKTDDDSYEARIFPVLNTEARKVKFSIIIPVKANAHSIELPLPLSMFRSDQDMYNPKINIEVLNNTFWGAPEMLETGGTIAVSGNSTNIVLEGSHLNLQSNYGLYFKNRTADDVFINSAENATDGYFQLFLSPKDDMPGKHFLFAVDYNQYYDPAYKEIQAALRTKLKFSLTNKDSFNIIYTKNGSVVTVSNQWLSATNDNITAALNHLSDITNSTKLTYEVIAKAIQFNNQQANKGGILLITNSNSQYYGATSSNSKINELISSMPQLYPLNIAHVCPERVFDFTGNSANGWKAFYNNEYFLSNLAALSGGTYNTRIRALDNYYISSIRALGDVLSTSIDYMMPKNLFDEMTYNISGIVADEYRQSGQIYSNQRDVLMITGRYFGGIGNVNLQRNYSANGMLYENTATLSPTEDQTFITRKIWASHMLSELIDNNGNGIYSGQIIAESMNYQVLTPYTAFLALEPDTLPRMVSNGTVDIEEHEAGTFEMIAMPNPFQDVQQIKIKLGMDMQYKNWDCTITDISGRVLQEQHGKTGSNELIISWKGASLPAGIYLIKVSIGGKQSTMKVVKQE